MSKMCYFLTSTPARPPRRRWDAAREKDAPEQEKESISPEENLILSRYPNSPFNDDKNCLPSSTPRRAVVEPDARSWPGAEVRRLRALRPQLTSRKAGLDPITNSSARTRAKCTASP